MVYFYVEPVSNDRIAVLPLKNAEGVVDRWIILCFKCHRQFAVSADIGVTVDAIGAVSTAKSFSCPHCHEWRARLIFGIIVPGGVRYCFSCGLAAEGQFRYGWFSCAYCSAEGRVSELLDTPPKDDAA